MDASLQSAEKSAAKVGKAANDTGKKVKGMGRNAGQAGIQFQQMVGQLQGGVSPFVAISQQAADLGIVLGAPLVGVIVSLGAVLAGVLFAALGKTEEAMERAKTTASELADEYLKLTKQTEQLAAVKLSTQMLADAAAIILVGEELTNLRKERDKLLSGAGEGSGVLGVTGVGGIASGKALKEIDKQIAAVDNRFQGLVRQQEFRQEQLNKIFNKTFTLADDPGAQTEAPGGGASGLGGQTFNQLVQEEIAALQLRGQLFNDSNATIEAEIMRFELAALNLFKEGSDEFLNAEQALADKRVELRKAADDKITKQTEQAAKKQQALADAARATALTGASALGNELNQIIKQSGKEGTGIAKALFLANKAIAVAQIIMDTQVGAAKAVGQAGIFGIPASAIIEATGFARAGLVAGLSVGEAFENGGIVGGNSFSGDKVPARVNSGEMILNKGQQSNLFNMANGGGGGSPNITLISTGEPQTVTGTQVGKGEVQIMIDNASKATEKRINGSLASGRGITFQSLQKGAKVQRNLR